MDKLPQQNSEKEMQQSDAAEFTALLAKLMQTKQQ